MSDKFNKITNPETGKKYRTIELDGSDSEEEREIAFERLAIDEDDYSGATKPAVRQNGNHASGRKKPP